MGSVCLRQGTGRSTLLAFVLWVGLLAAAPSAQAALSVSGGTLTYTDPSTANANTVVIGFDGVSFTLSDSVAIDATPGGGCSATGNTATCDAAGVTRIAVNVGPLDDSVVIGQ